MSASAIQARDFLALSDAALLQTKSLLLVARAIDDCVDAHAMGVVHGVAGVGKTFSLEHHLAQRPEIETVWVDSVQRPTMRRLAQELMFALTGAKPPGGRTCAQPTAPPTRPRSAFAGARLKANIDPWSFRRGRRSAVVRSAAAAPARGRCGRGR